MRDAENSDQGSLNPNRRDFLFTTGGGIAGGVSGIAWYRWSVRGKSPFPRLDRTAEHLKGDDRPRYESQPGRINRIFIEPYQRMDEGIVINWHTDEHIVEGTLELRREDSERWNSFVSTEPSSFPARSEVCHRVVLDHLDADTIYEFRIDEGKTRKFRTFPENYTRDITIVAASDHQKSGDIDDPIFRMINQAMANSDPDLVVATGDIVGDSGNTSPTAGDDWAEFLDILQTDLLENDEGFMTPILFLVGNHDTDPNHLIGQEEPDHPPIHLQTLCHALWDNSESNYEGGYGYLTAGSWLQILCLDTNHSNRLKDQISWLKNLYNESSDSYDHVLGIQHIHPFPSSRDLFGGYSTSMEILRQEIHPIYQKFGVEYVIVGHEHLWSVSPRINIPEGYGEIGRNDNELIANSDEDGIRYIGGGSWHSSTGPRNANNSDKWWIEQAEEVWNCWTLTITDSQTATGRDFRENVLWESENHSAASYASTAAIFSKLGLPLK